MGNCGKMWGKVQNTVENSKNQLGKLILSSEISEHPIFSEIKKITITDTHQINQIILTQSFNLLSNVSRRIFTQSGRKGAPGSSF